MKRGEIWTISGGGAYAGKPRPAVIVQNDQFDATASITVCAFTTNLVEAPDFRLPIEPDAENGLRAVCRIMVDKVTTVPRVRLGNRIGRLRDEDLIRLDHSMMIFLGLTGPAEETTR